ncbi:MAG: MBL fold metallo-hydrolase, partial [Planctomycetota bacterium]|nr:MBL fold metallo-hydrolase [Planctomycetota bacterium]
LVVGVWAIFGLTLLPADREEGSLRCTVLSVGHGLSVIVETPSGRTLVYDVGSRAGGELSSRVLKEALWARGISKVNALIVSHSDVDHYNGVLDLLESLPVGRILCSRHFPDSRQPLTLTTLDRAEESGVSPVFIAQGDRLSLDSAVTMRILQPVAATSYDSDNAASVVLEIEFQGRRILLTGDLDEDGLEELLKQPARKVDVLLAPHHGSTAANPAELAVWARPTFVVASAPTSSYQRQLESIYGPEAHVMTTSDSGAVTATISRNGKLDLEPFLNAAR